MRKLVFILFIFPCLIFAQNITIDSLKLALKNAKHDTTRCNILNAIIEAEVDDRVWYKYNEQLYSLAEKNIVVSEGLLKFQYLRYLSDAINNKGFITEQRGDVKGALVNYNKSLKIKEGINDKKGIADLLNNIGLVYINQGNISMALQNFEKCLRYQQELKSKIGIAHSLNSIGFVYDNLGDISKALDYYLKSLKMQEEINNESGIAISLMNIGYIYITLREYPKALECYQRSLKIREKRNDKLGVANCLSSLGQIYLYQDNVIKALGCFNQSLSIGEQLQNKSGIALALTNLGWVYEKSDNSKSLEYYQKSLIIQEEIQNKFGISSALQNIARLNLEKGNLVIAQSNGLKSLLLTQELGFPSGISISAKILKNIYKGQNKYELAFKMYELEVKMRDSINNQETQKAAVKKQMQYTYDKKELEMKAEQDKKDIISKGELKQKERERNYFIAGFGLVLLLSLFIFRGYKQKQKANEIITLQKMLVEEKQKEILDSIHYAKRIQNALLTNESYIHKNLNKLNINTD